MSTSFKRNMILKSTEQLIKEYDLDTRSALYVITKLTKLIKSQYKSNIVKNPGNNLMFKFTVINGTLLLIGSILGLL